MTRSLWRILVGMVAVAGVTSDARHATADQPAISKQPEAAGVVEYRRPELVAITWSTARLAPNVDDKQAFWRPDGSLLDADEIAWMRKDLGEFQRLDWQKAIEHRPLILIFRVDEKSKPHAVLPLLRVGERLIEPSLANASSKNFLAVSGIAPRLTEFAQWPAEVDLDVQWPMGPWERFKQVDGVPKEPVAIAPGVRWYFDGEAARSRFGQEGFPACVLEVAENEVEPLRRYQFIVNLEGGGQRSWNTRRSEPERTLMVTEPIDDDFKIKSAEFYVTRFRRERLRKIPTFPERLVK